MTKSTIQHHARHFRHLGACGLPTHTLRQARRTSGDSAYCCDQETFDGLSEIRTLCLSRDFTKLSRLETEAIRLAGLKCASDHARVDQLASSPDSDRYLRSQLGDSRDPLSAADSTGQTLVVLTRSSGYLTLRSGKVPPASTELEMDGYTVLRGVFKPPQVESLSADVQRVFAQYPPDVRDPDDDIGQMAPFRYEMLNRSALVQRAVGNPRILRTIEPLLGEDCHVIANTAWWQPPGNNEHLGRFWHIDGGPHIPRDPDVPWDPRIPYPIFVIAAHIFLRDCPLEAGPTAVIPRSHTSGRPPPIDGWPTPVWSGRVTLRYLSWRRQEMSHSSPLTSGTRGRRRERTTPDVCSSNATTGAVTLRSASDRHIGEPSQRGCAARAKTPRQQTLIGHHPPELLRRLNEHSSLRILRGTGLVSARRLQTPCNGWTFTERSVVESW